MEKKHARIEKKMNALQKLVDPKAAKSKIDNQDCGGAAIGIGFAGTFALPKMKY